VVHHDVAWPGRPREPSGCRQRMAGRLTLFFSRKEILRLAYFQARAFGQGRPKHLRQTAVVTLIYIFEITSRGDSFAANARCLQFLGSAGSPAALRPPFTSFVARRWTFCWVLFLFDYEFNAVLVLSCVGFASLFFTASKRALVRASCLWSIFLVFCLFWLSFTCSTPRSDESRRVTNCRRAFFHGGHASTAANRPEAGGEAGPGGQVPQGSRLPISLSARTRPGRPGANRTAPCVACT